MVIEIFEFVDKCPLLSFFQAVSEHSPRVETQSFFCMDFSLCGHSLEPRSYRLRLRLGCLKTLEILSSDIRRASALVDRRWHTMQGAVAVTCCRAIDGKSSFFRRYIHVCHYTFLAVHLCNDIYWRNLCIQREKETDRHRQTDRQTERQTGTDR